MDEKHSFPPATAEQADTFSELYSQHFYPAVGATCDFQQAEATPFKIFSLTKDDVNVSYGNSAKIQ